ncbi:MAG: CPBP family intramembrane metalloprotease [Candidatus Hydrogenedentes bacterium]|nr:CPBP family intramembrane metalloprotease [Candidatus Hydrogenedentota bacterium]
MSGEAGEATSGFAEVRAPETYGPWLTLGLSAACLVLMMGVGTAVSVPAVWVLCSLLGRPFPPLRELQGDGLFLVVATAVSAAITIAFLAAAVAFRRVRFRDYLNLRLPGWRDTARWCAFLALFLAASDLTTVSLGRPLVQPWMASIYEDAGSLVLLALAILVLAPFHEELLFRGFLFKGIECSRWGGAAAIALSALPWALLHVQYDVYGMGLILAEGVFLGVCRLRTKSTGLAILMHGLANAVALIETAVHADLN